MQTPIQTTIEHGSTVIPADIIKALNVKDGQQLNWHISPTGAVFLRFKNKTVEDVQGLLTTDHSVSIEEMHV